MGILCRDGEESSWPQRFAAQLPGSSWRMDQPTQQILGKLAGFSTVACISGNPSIGACGAEQTKTDLRSPGLESLFESMAGVRWAYMVLARPLNDQELNEDLQRTEMELQETNSAYLRRGSAEENNNPQVTRYVALLESAQEKLIQGQKHGMWDVQSYLMTDTMSDCERGTQALHAAFSGPDSAPQPLRIKSGSRNGIREPSARMTTRLNTAEVAALASLPRREVPGLQVTDHVPFGMTGCAGGQSAIALGTLMSCGTSTSLWFEIQKDSLNKHMFVAGVPGSGKTRTCLYLLTQLWREHQTPWLVLEPSMKSEYRTLLRSSLGADLRIFTAGDESVSPLRMNPMEVPRGVHVQTHIGYLTTLFKAAFAMEAPMPYVLDDAIHHVYEEHGWDLVSGTHSSGGNECQPTLADLLVTCNKVVQDLGYDNQLKANIQAALRTRLTSLMRGAKGRMLNVTKSISIDDLLSAPTVIEFAAIGDDDEKAFLLGCILLKLAQHRQTQGLATAGLRHVTLIEEAHRLLRNVPETMGTSVANPRRQAVEAFSNMLAELRAYGEGLVVVDQMPSKLVPDVIRNSGIKVVHRLVAEEERKIVGGAMSLNEPQTRFLSALSAGQAIVYADGNANACRVLIPDQAGREGYLKDSPSHAEVRAHMKPHIQRVADIQATAGIATPIESTRPCTNTCPAGACATRDAVDAYANRHCEDLKTSFQKALAEGFDALWQFGENIAHEIWPAGDRKADGPFCAVMVVAGRLGMVEEDMRVLRRNMVRVGVNHRQGYRS
ncbi:MAG: ATP-binding protein [Kiritimatiellia bacterium]